MTSHGIRRQTRRQIYEFVHEQGLATKREISTALNLSLPTVSKYLTHFVKEGLMRPAAKVSPGLQGGRSPIAYGCVTDGRLAVGVDITRDTITCLLVDLGRNVLAQRNAAVPFDRSDDYFRVVANEIESMITDSGVEQRRILGVGIAVPGLVSETTGSVTYGRVIDNFGMSAEDFGRFIPYRTRIVHDSDAAGQAEFWPDYGPGNAVYVSLSRSVGGSVLIGGEIYRGDGEFAGEIGHLCIHANGLACYCGQRGCMDPYCNSSVLYRHTDGSLDLFFQKLSQNDPDIRAVWDKYASDLALALHNVRVLFGCRIIIGGAVGARIKPYIADIRNKVDALGFLATDSRTFLFPSVYLREPVATGAALYLIDNFRQELGPLPSADDEPTPRLVSLSDN